MSNAQRDHVEELNKTNRIIYVEWISTIAIFLSCFAFLTYKIEKQSDRTDRIYDMFVDLRKENEETRREVDRKFYDILKERKNG